VVGPCTVQQLYWGSSVGVDEGLGASLLDDVTR
jgi:hypothetical protein